MVDNGRKITFRLDEELYIEICDYLRERNMQVSEFARLSMKKQIQGGESALLSGAELEEFYTDKIDEIKKDFAFEKLSMEVRLQTLRAEKAECQVELERLKAENEHLKMDAVYREALQHAQNRANADSKLKSEEKNQSVEQGSEETADYYADEAEMFYY